MNDSNDAKHSTRKNSLQTAATVGAAFVLPRLLMMYTGNKPGAFEDELPLHT